MRQKSFSQMNILKNDTVNKTVFDCKAFQPDRVTSIGFNTNMVFPIRERDLAGSLMNNCAWIFFALSKFYFCVYFINYMLLFS